MSSPPSNIVDAGPTRKHPKRGRPPAREPFYSHEAGKQISLRLAPEVLAKLEALAREAVQTKSQYITKWLLELPEINDKESA
jgi:hypothetical protein